ncbi:hypothetical protein M378DRAFT_171224 [Amanita muscaria Koide BX008]|uniref:Uncharacterized protein n=1 Tax=Amanita muscaria (strain Koide BX008) TaxID=946122 RepID=A0A0C2S5C0_AMAMK|nr:hypothetical protein M378DRAFT_171224 [Amanita muscaria Koide BX008]
MCRRTMRKVIFAPVVLDIHPRGCILCRIKPLTLSNNFREIAMATMAPLHTEKSIGHSIGPCGCLINCFFLSSRDERALENGHSVECCMRVAA